MLINCEINTNLKINNLVDLNKLKNKKSKIPKKIEKKQKNYS